MLQHAAAPASCVLTESHEQRRLKIRCSESLRQRCTSVQTFRWSRLLKFSHTKGKCRGPIPTPLRFSAIIIVTAGSDVQKHYDTFHTGGWEASHHSRRLAIMPSHRPSPQKVPPPPVVDVAPAPRNIMGACNMLWRCNTLGHNNQCVPAAGILPGFRLFVVLGFFLGSCTPPMSARLTHWLAPDSDHLGIRGR